MLGKRLTKIFELEFQIDRIREGTENNRSQKRTALKICPKGYSDVIPIRTNNNSISML